MICDYPGEIITWVFLCPNLSRKVRRIGAIMNHIGRITSQHHTIYEVDYEGIMLEAKISGSFRYRAKNNTEYPAVGDYVYLEQVNHELGTAIIKELKQRRNVLKRTEAGTRGESQIIAANIDYSFICTSCNQDFNERRLERYFAMAIGEKIEPIVVLTKSDLCNNLEHFKARIQSCMQGITIIESSSFDKTGIKQLKELLKENITAVFTGSSGIGKSTLINQLMGEEVLATSDIRKEDAKGRHTTTYRQLLKLPEGAYIIDTPGMRELALDDSSVDDTFLDIIELSSNCKFGNCSHTKEPGCKVLLALKSGMLEDKRYKSYCKLKKEETNRKGRKFARH